MRQLAERNGGGQPSKKFRTYAPKGSRLAAGYEDRAINRAKSDDEDEGDKDDKSKRIKALSEQLKLGNIDRETFDKLSEEITGGDVGSTHLVRGLDRKLLERVRRGEDVMGTGKKAEGASEDVDDDVDVDDEFEKLEQQEVKAIVKEKVEKKGEKAAPPPVAGVKRSRDAILAELKAQRKAAQEAKIAALPKLDSRFTKIGEKKGNTRIEVDEKGREVLITVDEDGNVKRKVRKVKKEDGELLGGLLEVDRSKAIGMIVPELPKAPSEDEDEDIFAGAGQDYNPLGDEDDSSSEDEGKDEEKAVPPPTTTHKEDNPPPNSDSEEGEIASDDEETPEDHRISPKEASKPAPAQPSAPRNYFGTSTAAIEPEASGPSKDALMAIIAKAKKMDSTQLGDMDDEDGESGEKDGGKAERLKKKAALLAAQDRDLDDMDLGFGSSRFDDADDFEAEGKKLKLAEWKGAGKDDDEDDKERGGKKRKRGPKKRKGDKDSAADVLRVMEQRKAK